VTASRPDDPLRLAGTLVTGHAHTYRVDRPLDQGGFAAVYVAHRIDPVGGNPAGAEVALKVLDVPHLTQRLAEAPPAFLDPDAPLAQQMAEVRERFLNESHLLRTLRHRNIVHALDEGFLPADRHRAPFYVMEHLRGADIENLVRRRGKLPPDAGVVVTGALLAALDHLARNDIVHRDVKAANIALLPSARTTPAAADVRLIDFGLATTVPRAGGTTRTILPYVVPTRADVVWGTLAWCPPERLAPGVDPDGAASPFHPDLWGAGLLLYLCLTGIQPFDRCHHPADVDQFAAIIEGRFPPPRRIVADLPPRLEAVALRALALRPADRYPSASAFLEDLHPT
jgi:serine/threonine-protein kinase